MLKLDLDFRSDIPLTNQVVAQIQQQLANGALKPGDQLPTVRALAQELRINFNTVARAYRILDEAGIISTQQGRGTYILEQPPPITSERLRRESLENLAWAFRTALPEVLTISPQSGDFIDLDPKIEVTFNQPMDTASVESAFALRGPEGSKVPGTFSWNERGTACSPFAGQKVENDRRKRSSSACAHFVGYTFPKLHLFTCYVALILENTVLERILAEIRD